MRSQDFVVESDEKAGCVRSIQLYGQELLDTSTSCESELWVNGLPLKMRPHADPNQPGKPHLKGERFVNQFSGWALVLARRMGERASLKHRCFGIQSLIRRELCDQTYPRPGPGGPVVEVPLYVDTFSLLNWNWQFWGDDTRMMFPSSHSSGPDDEWGHTGYEHDTPENCKKFLQNIWRRIYPGCLLIHGGLFYNASTQHWLALTCRQPAVGYHLNIENSGRGVSYDFTLHAPFELGQNLQMPEIKIYFGPSRETMMAWLGDYITHYYQEPPEWVHRKVWGGGLAWDNQPTWTEQAEHWEKELGDSQYSGLGYSLVTNRPIKSGTTPLGYEPDPNHGTIEEFQAMCRRIAARGVPFLVWMSHSGLLYGGGAEIDDDWFIRGVDGRVCGAWGAIDGGGLTHINPGHPGYIEYTKKWIRFYIKECGAKGIFFDCLSWAFPPDFKPRPWMRFPADTNLMTIKFMREVYACIKECDPDAMMLGEGASLEGPVNVVSIHTNPKRAIDGLGPRDFLLQLNQYAPKRLVIDQGPALAPASGYCLTAKNAPEHNRFMVELLRERGGRDTWTHLPHDLSIMDDLLAVPFSKNEGENEDESEPDCQVPLPVCLPAPWNETRVLTEVITGARLNCKEPGQFSSVPPGIYRMK